MTFDPNGGRRLFDRMRETGALAARNQAHGRWAAGWFDYEADLYALTAETAHEDRRHSRNSHDGSHDHSARGNNREPEMRARGLPLTDPFYGL